eukprot:scaffold635_cov535-Prasinococcus_capsulatus_cf.AAC.14
MPAITPVVMQRAFSSSCTCCCRLHAGLFSVCACAYSSVDDLRTPWSSPAGNIRPRTACTFWHLASIMSLASAYDSPTVLS